jgi:hypothetical protein
MAARFWMCDYLVRPDVIDQNPDFAKLQARLVKRTDKICKALNPVLQHLLLPREFYPLVQPDAQQPAQFVPSPSMVRFVVVSDTHKMHKALNMPAGEVLLHCGDLVGNYGDDCDLRDHILKLARWLNKLPYRRILLIPGNHDTELDVQKYPENKPILEEFMSSIAPHISLLVHGGVEYRGLKIFGSPYLVDRLEEQGVRYYSNAFETKSTVRRQIWATLPEGLDILMTHTPPVGESGDPLLAERLHAMQTPPLMHCVGHAHREMGVSLHPCGQVQALPLLHASTGQPLLQGSRQRLLINAAQQMPLTEEPGCGGLPWVFDLIARDGSEIVI